MTERCLDQHILGGLIDPRKDLELSRAQCDAISASCKAWEELVSAAGNISTQSEPYDRLRKEMGRKIRDAINNLSDKDKKFLFAEDITDPFGRSRFDQALDARILDLSYQVGETRPVILDYTADRLYWRGYKSRVPRSPNKN